MQVDDENPPVGSKDIRNPLFNTRILRMHDLYGISGMMWEFGKMSLILKRSDISYLKFIMEGYDGLGIVTTQDPFTAQAMVTYPLSRRQTLEKLIDALVEEGVIKEVIES